MENQTADYVAIAVGYARAASLDKNRHRFGKWMRLAARRFLNDLRRVRDGSAPFTFDEWHACDPCDFIEKLPHVEGTWDTPTITLHESDVFFLVALFGFRNPDGTRRFTQALKCIARKNAKSTLAACIGLYCETCEGEVGPQVITAATTGNQARIVFNIAKRMVDRTSDLREAFNLEGFVNAITCYDNGGTYKPINSKASNQDGLNPSCTILDEIHAHKSHDLLNVLRSAAGARKNPLFLYTTTEGYESEGPWPELRHFAEQVLEGVVTDADHFFCVIYALDDEERDENDKLIRKADDDFDESSWIKANPLMTVNPLLMKELQKEAIEAKQMPGRHAEFKIKRLNRREAAQGRWVNLPKWKACTGTYDIESMHGWSCYGGLDLASVNDLASFRLAFRTDDDGWITHGWRFVTEAARKKRERAGLVPYKHWIQSGHLIVAGEDVLDYDVIHATILQASQDFDLISVAYDTWNATQLAAKLSDDDIEMIPFIQGPKSYHPAMKEVERAYTSRKLIHGNDPVLNWNMSNVIARLDVNMNQAPDKKRAIEKIDDACTLFMAIGSALTEEGEGGGDIMDALRSPVIA